MQQNYKSDTIKPIKRFLRLLSLERREIGHIYFYAIFHGLIYLSLPLGIQAIISFVMANQLSSSWGLLVVIVTLGTLFAGVLQLMQMTITESLQQRIFTRASFEFAYRIPRIKIETISKYYPPELVNRFFDTLTIQKGLPKILIDLSTASLQILFGLILLSFYHPFFIAFGFFLLIMLFLIFRFTGPRGLQTSLEESDFKYKVVYWLEELARALTSFKLAGETDLALKKADQYVANYLVARKKHFRILIFQFGNIIAFKTIVTASLLVLGSILLIQRQLNVGQFVASEIIIILVIASVEKLILSMETIYDVLTAVEKLGKVTDLPLESYEGLDFNEIDTGNGIQIEMKNVGFKFLYDQRKSLQNINLTINSGEKVCITGYSGAGKSLLLSVLSGLYENYEGQIALNRVSLKNINDISLRTHIGDFLSQKNLFKGTIAENIHMGREGINFYDIQWAIEKAGLSNFVESLDEGYTTSIVPESPQLPNSIVQKIILARCLVKKPQLLVMDDSFSIWEKQERNNLYRFLCSSENKTVIAVSNEKNFAAQCDKIVVMKEGRILDVDSFTEIKQKPYFEDLFK